MLVTCLSSFYFEVVDNIWVYENVTLLLWTSLRHELFHFSNNMILTRMFTLNQSCDQQSYHIVFSWIINSLINFFIRNISVWQKRSLQFPLLLITYFLYINLSVKELSISPHKFKQAIIENKLYPISILPFYIIKFFTLLNFKIQHCSVWSFAIYISKNH